MITTCWQGNYFVKVDDDVYLNIRLLVSRLPHLPKKPLLQGQLVANSVPLRQVWRG